MIHLSALSIKNFRVLQDITIKSLGDINLIVGRNNSGKSTVLEALSLFSGGCSTASILQVARHKDDTVYTKLGMRSDEKIQFENLFTNKKYPVDGSSLKVGDPDSEKFIEINHVLFEEIIEKQKIDLFSEEKTIRYQVVDSEKLQGLQSKIQDNLHEGLKISSLDMSEIIPEDDFRRSRWRHFTQIYPSTYISTQLSSIEELSQAWDDLTFTDNEKYVIEALKLIDDRIEALAFIKDENIHYRFSSSIESKRSMHELRVPYLKISGSTERVPLHSMGDGVIRLLQIVLKVFSAKDGLLLIDEFENGLHYSVQEKVWQWIFSMSKRFNIQVFATTHSWDSIETFAKVSEANKLKGVLFRVAKSVRKTDKGKIVATTFDENELFNITKSHIEVR